MSGSPGTFASRLWQPSNSRRVTVDGFLPLPRGIRPAAPSLPIWPAKDPADTLDYELDLSPALLGSEQDSVTSVSVAVSPIDTLLVGQVAGDSTIAVVWLSGGNAGTVYAVQVTAGMASGRIIARTVLLAVQALAPAAVPPTLTTGLTAQNGLTITDESGSPILVSG